MESVPALPLVETPALPEGVESYPLPQSLQESLDELELPQGYALVGGAARAVAFQILTGHSGMPVRDIDVGAFTDYQPDGTKANEIAARLMPDDFMFRHGVRTTSLKEYFETRDFTFNEVAVIDSSLLVSKQAAYDLAKNIIRPTRYEHDPEHDYHLSERLALKAVLQRVVLEHSTGKPARIEGFNPQDYCCDLRYNEDTGIRPFHMALALQKAMEYGDEITSTFVESLLAENMLVLPSTADHITTATRIILAAQELEALSDFEFRGRAAEYLARRTSLGEIAVHDSYSDASWAAQCASAENVFATNAEPTPDDPYDRYEEIAQRFSGLGNHYTNEARY